MTLALHRATRLRTFDREYETYLDSDDVLSLKRFIRDEISPGLWLDREKLQRRHVEYVSLWN